MIKFNRKHTLKKHLVMRDLEKKIRLAEEDINEFLEHYGKK